MKVFDQVCKTPGCQFFYSVALEMHR